jgi:hypothetical protein
MANTDLKSLVLHQTSRYNTKDKIIQWYGGLWYVFIHSQALIVQEGPLASLFGVSVITHTHTDTRQDSSGRDQPVAETSTYTGQHNI